MAEDSTPAPSAGRPLGLSPRLAAIASLVPAGAHVVDVGTGHGQLPAWLALTGRAKAPLATERHHVEARKLAGLARRAGFELRVGDGLAALVASDRAEVIVVSGLGSRAMRRILEGGGQRVHGARRLVLQPQTESGALRRWLVERAFEIVDERLVGDRGRSYVVIAAEPRGGVRRPTHPLLGYDELLEAGPCLVRSGDPEVRRQWNATRRRLERILSRGGVGAAPTRAASGLELARRVLAAIDGGPGADPGALRR